MARHLCGVSYEEEMAFAAVVGEPESERIVGASSYFLDPRSGLADIAYMVDPEWQGVGLGGVLHARTIEYARGRGARGLTADVLSDNAAMLAVFRRSGCRVTSRPGDGVVELEVLFDEPAEDPSGGVTEPESAARRPGSVHRRPSGKTRQANRTSRRLPR